MNTAVKVCLGVLAAGFIGMAGCTILVGTAVSNAVEEGKKAETKKVASRMDALTNAPIDPMTYGELEPIFKMGSKHTDVQRDNKAAEIKDKKISWELKVYEVKKTNAGYKIQCSGSPGVWVHLGNKNAAVVEALKTGDLIKFEGLIEEVDFMRSIVVNPARLK